MFKLTIGTPERRLLFGQDADEVTLPGHRGELNILPGHAPLITTLQAGVIKWKLKGSEKQEIAVVSWGYCQVSPEGVNVLANIIDLPEEINLTETKDAMGEIEKRIMNEFLTDDEATHAQREWSRARAKIDVAEAKHLN